jgi:glycosidase
MSFTTPRWLSSAVIYEVFVRNHGPRGGFDAVRADLGRIRALGADVVWLMPIHPIGEKNRLGLVGSPYAIRDFDAVNPELGDEAGLKRLIDACHEQGMKLILDIVFNHTSPDSVLACEHPEWFLRNAEGRPVAKFPEWTDIADLRYFEPDGTPRRALWDRQISTLERWAALGADGFRCDVASVIPPAFWAEARERTARVAGGELLWLAETVHKPFLKFMRDRGHRAWSDGEMLQVFDLSYDHDGAGYLDEYFAGRGPLSRYLDHLTVQEAMNPENSLKLRFVENHDQPRAADKIRGEARLRSWTAFQALLPGTFLVYAGQEFAIEQRPGLFDPCPIAFPEASDKARHGFADFMAELLAAAKRIKRSCRYWSVREEASGLVVLTWSDALDGEPEYTAVLNLEDRFGTLAHDLGRGTNLLDGNETDLSAGKPIPREPVVLKN